MMPKSKKKLIEMYQRKYEETHWKYKDARTDS